MITSLILLSIILLSLIIKNVKLVSIALVFLLVNQISNNIILAFVLALVLFYLIPKLFVANFYLTVLLLTIVFYPINLIAAIILTIISLFLLKWEKYIFSFVSTFLLILVLDNMYQISTYTQIAIFVIALLLSVYIKKDTKHVAR